MQSRQIGEFRVRGFIISIVFFFAFGWCIYSRFSFKTDLPKQQEATSGQIESPMQRLDLLEKQVESNQKMIEDLERRTQPGKASRESTKRVNKKR